MGREKAADEVFCRSCGEAIKEEAEICPNCGVRNQDSGPTRSKTTSTQSRKASKGSKNASARSETSSGTSSTEHDPSQYETTVSDSWWYGVAGGVGLWIVAILFSSVGSTGGPLTTFAGLLMVVAWFGLPVAAYFDMQYVRANGQWNPNTVVWVVLLAIWIVNIVAGAVYLYRRHEVLDEP